MFMCTSSRAIGPGELAALDLAADRLQAAEDRVALRLVEYPHVA